MNLPITCFINVLLFTSIFFFSGVYQLKAQDFYKSTNFEKYYTANSKIKAPASDEQRVVFMGNSITEAWPVLSPDFFKNNKNYIGRGISGQTSYQMLFRFRREVLNLKPKVVVILAGTNDVAQNTGYTPNDIVAENVMTMAELAQFHGIKVIICSVIPAIDFPWRRGLRPADKILELNDLLKKYASENDLLYVDYHVALKDEQNGLRVPEFTSENDLVHPNADGYKVMERLIQPAIRKVLGKKK